MTIETYIDVLSLDPKKDTIYGKAKGYPFTIDDCSYIACYHPQPSMICGDKLKNKVVDIRSVPDSKSIMKFLVTSDDIMCCLMPDNENANASVPYFIREATTVLRDNGHRINSNTQLTFIDKFLEIKTEKIINLI